MRRLLALLFAATALAQSPDVAQKIRDAQKALGAGDCTCAQTPLREVIAADPKNYPAHVLSAHCFLRQKDYAAAVGEFRRMLELRPDTPQGPLGLIEAYTRSGDVAQRDAEIAHLLALMEAGRIPMTLRFVRGELTAGDRGVVVSEYPHVTALRSRHVFDVVDAQQKPEQRLELVTREADQAAHHNRPLRRAAAGVRRYSLVLAGVAASDAA